MMAMVMVGGKLVGMPNFMVELLHLWGMFGAVAATDIEVAAAVPKLAALGSHML